MSRRLDLGAKRFLFPAETNDLLLMAREGVLYHAEMLVFMTKENG